MVPNIPTNIATAPEMTSFRILGSIEVWSGQDRRALGGPRQVSLFAFLLLNANRPVTRDVVTDALWGPVRSGADNRLQMAVARLRKSLAALDEPAGTLLRTVTGGYSLSLLPGQLDADVFVARVQEGLRAADAGEWLAATEVLSEALALWRGPPLAEVAYEEFAQGEIRRLEELRRIAVETRIDAALRLGQYGELIGELERLLVEDPLRERTAGQLMLALYRSGRQADALDVYRRTRKQLTAQLGLEPGRELRKLEAEILAQAPTLENARSRPAATSSRSSTRTPLSPLASALGDSGLEHAGEWRRRGSASSSTHTVQCSMRPSLNPVVRSPGPGRHRHNESWTAPR
jgi:DNA-binding SARP family transcriptional activator